jgi:hypothetical protein
MDELVQAQAAYIKFLSKCLSDMAVYLHIHNMDPTEEQIEEGKKLRQRIAAAELAEQDRP